MNIRIVIFGKIKNPEIAQLVSYYQKLCNRYANVSLDVLKENNEKIDYTKLERLKKANRTLILLDEHGKSFTTLRFASLLEEIKNNSKQVTFVIANAKGFNKKALEIADLTLRLSDFTLPHELAGVVLFEQLFRCLNLLHGGKYHIGD